MNEFLKCDAEGCDHVEQVGTITEDHVNMPCPACGANLLTQADWDDWKSMQGLLTAIEGVAVPADESDPGIAVSVGLHNKETTIKITKN